MNVMIGWETSCFSIFLLRPLCLCCRCMMTWCLMDLRYHICGLDAKGEATSFILGIESRKIKKCSPSMLPYVNLPQELAENERNVIKEVRRLRFVEKVMMSIFFLQTLQLIKLYSRGIFQEIKNRNDVFKARQEIEDAQYDKNQ